MGSTSSTSTPLYFTGVSQYSSDFQSIIQRAVQIAQIPITTLQNEELTNTNQVQELQTLNPEVAAIGTDVAALGTLATNQALGATTSDSSIVTAVNTGATAPASYTVSDISSLASAASETSVQGYSATQTVSASGLVNLVVGSNTYQLDLPGSGQNTVSGLAQAINNADAGVTATVLTAGSSEYLAVSANNTGATTLQLNAVTPVDLISNDGTGTETSLQTYADETSTAVSATGQVQLVVGSQTYSLDVSNDNNLDGLVQAIDNAGAGVTASITGSAGAYSLSITSASGPTTIQLNDLQSPTDLISDSNQGSDASFYLNGIQITESSNTITDVIPGVSFTLNGTTSGSATITLSSDPSQLSSALENLVNDYNTLVTQVQAQYGTSAGPLNGDPIIDQISDDMQQLVTYWNPASNSSIRSLSDLGISLSDTGQMSFDSSTFNSLSDSQISDAFAFLGSSSTGFGALASNFTQLSDPVTGAIEAEENGLNQDNTQLGDQITTLNDQAAQIQATATAEAQQADALCAELESQQSTLDASLESLSYVLYGKPASSS